MKKLNQKLKAVVLSLALCLQVVFPTLNVQAGQTFYNNTTGNEDGYDYELWKDNGSTSMTINGGGKFECWWENIGNALFRKGKKFDCTQTYQQVGNISIDFGVDYQPNGNSYLCVYGWTRNPLVEYYIVESWGSWRPPGATSKGTITVDGGTYDVYETTRVNQPSIDGDTTFQQYWSVRTSKRTSGTISVSEHFAAWERMGMKMGNLYEVALNVEGYQSSGWADVYKNDIRIGGSISSGSSSDSSSGSGSSAAPGTAQGTRIECENMTISGQYAGTISSPFSGVALYANDESVSYTQNFTSGTHDFTLSGASDGSEMARVDLVIGGQNKGTFYFGDSNHAEYTIKNVSHGTGNQKIELVVNEDDGSWDAYVDALIISGSGVGGNTGSNTGNTGNTDSNTGSGSTKIECESMTISGQYAGTISSPFSGVALYANDESVKFTQNFTSGTSTFVLRGASDGSNMAKVDLKVGGQSKGTFYFGDANTAEFTIENVSHGTGNQQVELVVTADDGSWDAYLDSLTIIGGVGESTGSNTGNTGSNTGNTGNTDSNTGSGSTKIECESMTISGQYAGTISSPFSGVALYANDESVKFTQNFTSGTSTFVLRGASNGSNMAKVDLKVGGQSKGTFYFGDANTAEFTIENVSHGTGNQQVELVVTADDGSWDAYLDSLTIIGGVGESTGSNTGNTGSNTGNTGNTDSNTGSGSTKIECESMTISGQYAGTISSPFSGVALYANDESVKFTQNFTSGTSTFVLRGASNGSNMAKVDLKVGGQSKGTFYFGDANTAEFTIENVSHGTGNQQVELVVTADDGSWDAYLDSLTIIGGVGESTGSNTGNTGSNAGNTGNTDSNTGSGSTKIECENMAISGQYAGSISSPFTGVALYANDESVKFTHNFTSTTDNFTLRGASDCDSMAKVDLKIGGQSKGTFYFGDANPAEYTIENVSHGTGNQQIELVVTADDGSWDAYLDYLRIGGEISSNNSSTGSNNSGNNGYNGGKLVALSFDDGPSSTTSEVLDILEREGIVATFFLIGENVNSSTASIMQRQVNMGCELANHSYNHVDMSNYSASDIRSQISWTQSAIENTVGVTPKFFRPPYLGTSNTMYENIDLAFIQGIVSQDHDSSVSASQRVSNVLNNVTDGSIVLLHDFQGNSQTVQALPQIIQSLKNQGYTFVTISQLFEYKGVNPNQEYKIWSTVP